jgi:hypothetical protein
MTIKEKIPLKQLLESIDLNQKDFYTQLSEEQKKSFSGWLAMRFTSSCQQYPEHYLIMVNELVNTDFSSFKNHPELLWKLLCLCGAGIKTYHPWIPPSGKKSKNALRETLHESFVHLNSDEIDILLEINDNETFKQYFKDNGYQDDQIEKIFEGKDV